MVLHMKMLEQWPDLPRPGKTHTCTTNYSIYYIVRTAVVGNDHSSVSVASPFRPRQAIHAVSATSDHHLFYKTTQHAWRSARSTDSDIWDGFPKEHKAVHTVSTHEFFLALATVSLSRAAFLAAAASFLCRCAVSARLRSISCWWASIAACFALAVLFICKKIYICQKRVKIKHSSAYVSHHLDKERVRAILTPIQVLPEEKKKDGGKEAFWSLFRAGISALSTCYKHGSSIEGSIQPTDCFSD